MGDNSNSQQCQNWSQLTAGDSEIGSNLIEKFQDNGVVNSQVNEIRDVSTTAHNMIDPFKPAAVDNSYADIFYQSSIISDEVLRKCAAVNVLDTSIAPYSVNIPVCDQYNCETENTGYNHPEDKCGNI
jgi:hypothetical protein